MDAGSAASANARLERDKRHLSVAGGTCSLSIGPIRIALIGSEECAAVPSVHNPPGAWRPRGEPSAFDLIGSYHDEQENERLRCELRTTTDYLLLDRYPGPGELEDYLIEIGMLESRGCREREPLSEVLRRHDRVVASSLDDEFDGERLAARALTELAAKAGIGTIVFDQVGSAHGVLVRAFANGRRWELDLPNSKYVSILGLVAFLNTICRHLGLDLCFVELNRANHVTWGRWSAISRAARDGLFAFRLEQHWVCQVLDGLDGEPHEDSKDESDLDYLERDIIPPTRIEEALLEMAAGSAGISSSALVARIVAAIVSALERRFPGIQFNASYDPSSSLFEPVALVVAAASDVAWMRDHDVEAEIGDELAFRLIPSDIEQATERWPAIGLEAVVSSCERALGWVFADCFAPDWLRGLPIAFA